MNPDERRELCLYQRAARQTRGTLTNYTGHLKHLMMWLRQYPVEEGSSALTLTGYCRGLAASNKPLKSDRILREFMEDQSVPAATQNNIVAATASFIQTIGVPAPVTDAHDRRALAAYLVSQGHTGAAREDVRCLMFLADWQVLRGKSLAELLAAEPGVACHLIDEFVKSELASPEVAACIRGAFDNWKAAEAAKLMMLLERTPAAPLDSPLIDGLRCVGADNLMLHYHADVLEHLSNWLHGLPADLPLQDASVRALNAALHVSGQDPEAHPAVREFQSAFAGKPLARDVGKALAVLVRADASNEAAALHPQDCVAINAARRASLAEPREAERQAAFLRSLACRIYQQPASPVDDSVRPCLVDVLAPLVDSETTATERFAKLKANPQLRSFTDGFGKSEALGALSWLVTFQIEVLNRSRSSRSFASG